MATYLAVSPDGKHKVSVRARDLSAAARIAARDLPRGWFVMTREEYERRRAGAGEQRRRHPRSRVQRRTIDAELARRRRDAKKQTRDRYGRFG